jgi:peptidoglycan/xylan/chitin deacetylase (PgdA/CDA1 family)
MDQKHPPRVPQHHRSLAAPPATPGVDGPADTWPGTPAGSGAPRRSVLRAAGAGVAGLIGLGATRDGVHYRDRAAARRRGDAATIAPMTAATGLQVLWRARTERKVMALTFDDGPGGELTPRLLDALRDANVRATFFVVGRRAHERRDLVRAQARDGHELANHSWSHADLSVLDYPDVASELERTDRLLAEITGARPTVIRPPWGRINGAVLQHAAQTGQRILLWDVRFHESDLDAAGNAAHVLDRLRPGTVLLAHDAGRRNRWIGIDAIPAVIDGARAQGYEFVTAGELFRLHDAG